jgi:hypothetical protein
MRSKDVNAAKIIIDLCGKINVKEQGTMIIQAAGGLNVLGCLCD